MEHHYSPQKTVLTLELRGRHQKQTEHVISRILHPHQKRRTKRAGKTCGGHLILTRKTRSSLHEAFQAKCLPNLHLKTSIERFHSFSQELFWDITTPMLQKFFLSLDLSLPCCNFSPLLLTLSTKGIRGQMINHPFKTTLILFGDLSNPPIILLSLKLNKPSSFKLYLMLSSFLDFHIIFVVLLWIFYFVHTFF